MGDIGGLILSIRADDVEEFLDVVKKVDTDFYELRVDGLEEFDGFEKLRAFRDALIVTIRAEEQGGFKGFDEGERYDLFENVLDVEPAFVDVEYDTPLTGELMDLADKKGVDVILSYHDLEKTPSRDRLRDILKDMKKLEPDVIKIVTFAEVIEDNALICELYDRHGNLIAFCMGEKGRISRLFSLYLAPMTYVTLKGMETAPGQLSMEDVKTIDGVIR